MDLSPAEQERCYQNLIKGRGVSLRDEDLYYKMKDYFLN